MTMVALHFEHAITSILHLLISYPFWHKVLAQSFGTNKKRTGITVSFAVYNTWLVITVEGETDSQGRYTLSLMS